jgi:hypothetical protein
VGRIVCRPFDKFGLKRFFEAKGAAMKPRTMTALLFGVGVAIFTVSATPALAYWQFLERPPGFEVKPSPRYSSQKECEAALKKVEAALKKAYPDRYPLVGSCEEYR